MGVPLEQLALKAAQGIDVEDFLQQIAWTEVLRPRFQTAKDLLLRQLVDVTLNVGPGVQGGMREQIAGKLFGIDWVVKEIEGVVREGKVAREALRERNYNLET